MELISDQMIKGVPEPLERYGRMDCWCIYKPTLVCNDVFINTYIKTVH